EVAKDGIGRRVEVLLPGIQEPEPAVHEDDQEGEEDELANAERGRPKDREGIGLATWHLEDHAEDQEGGYVAEDGGGDRHMTDARRLDAQTLQDLERDRQSRDGEA